MRAIAENVLFAGMDEKTKLKIVKEMYLIEIDAEVPAIKHGEMGNNFYVVERGSFDILIPDEDSQDEFTMVASRGPGQCFGELALMYNAPRAATVTATEKSAVWVIDRFTFRRIAQDLGENKLQEYVEFLSNVELLQPLTKVCCFSFSFFSSFLFLFSFFFCCSFLLFCSFVWLICWSHRSLCFLFAPFSFVFC